MRSRRRTASAREGGGGFSPSGLSADGVHTLRAIRPRLDGDTYRGTDAEAAGLAGLSLGDARRALHDLATRGFIRLERTA